MLFDVRMGWRDMNLWSSWPFMMLLTARQARLASGLEQKLWWRIVTLDEIGRARCWRRLDKAAEKDWHCQQGSGDENEHF